MSASESAPHAEVPVLLANIHYGNSIAKPLHGKVGQKRANRRIHGRPCGKEGTMGGQFGAGPLGSLAGQRKVIGRVGWAKDEKDAARASRC